MAKWFHRCEHSSRQLADLADADSATPPDMIIAMIGVPGSGKTTFARAATEMLDARRVNRDQIKAELCGSVVAFDVIVNAGCYRLFAISQQLVRERVEEALAAGSVVVLDVNHDRRPARDRVRLLAERHNTPCVFVWMRSPARLAIERCVRRWREAASPEVVYADLDTATLSVQHHLAKLEPPTDENYITVDSKCPTDVQLSRVAAELHETGLLTK